MLTVADDVMIEYPRTADGVTAPQGRKTVCYRVRHRAPKRSVLSSEQGNKSLFLTDRVGWGT